LLVEVNPDLEFPGRGLPDFPVQSEFSHYCLTFLFPILSGSFGEDLLMRVHFARLLGTVNRISFFIIKDYRCVTLFGPACELLKSWQRYFPLEGSMRVKLMPDDPPALETDYDVKPLSLRFEREQGGDSGLPFG